MQNSSVQENDEFFEVLMAALANGDTTNSKLKDPITGKMMRDPVLISSGIVVDRSTVLN